MGKTARAVTLIVAALLAASVFLFAFAAALGMAVLGVIAFFTAYAVSPSDTKGFVTGVGAMIDRWVTAMTGMVQEAGNLVREVVKGGAAGRSGEAPTDGTAEGASAKDEKVG